MTVFLIVLGVIALLIIILLNLSATVTIIYDKGWQTKFSVLFIERDIEISKILSFLMFPDKKGEEAAENAKSKKKAKKEKKAAEAEKKTEAEKAESEKEPEKDVTADKTVSVEQKEEPKEENKGDQKPTDSAKPKPAKKNPIANLWEKDGIVGILTLVANLLDTANSAVLTLIRGLHIYSLYVMIIVGGWDADFIARSYGKLCQYYYPAKGLILSQMKVDRYDDYVQPDFLAESTEFQLQFIASISVGLLLKSGIKAGVVFLRNLIQNKKAK